jgi:hypothetical protein
VAERLEVDPDDLRADAVGEVIEALAVGSSRRDPPRATCLASTPPGATIGRP